MIISHTHKYLFVEVPHTVSTAISQELREQYDGKKILYKHATYNEFLNIASPEEKTYFVFSGIRNPLDDVVSVYFKYKTNHLQAWTNPTKVQKQGSYRGMRRYRFVHETAADFPTYFKTFHTLSYSNLGLLAYKASDFVIRFENVQHDFAKVLGLIGIALKRPLPLVNKTKGRERNFVSYYTPEIIPRTKRVFGPYMQHVGYTFPPEWGDMAVPGWNRRVFQVYAQCHYIYWRYLRSHMKAGYADRPSLSTAPPA